MLDFSDPKITESISKLSFLWSDLDLRVIADHIDDKGKAELWFYHSNGKGDQFLNASSVNLLSTTTMNSVSRRMELNSKDIPWTKVLTFIAKTTLEYQRKGEPGTIIEPVPGGVKHPGYFIEPVLLKGLPNLIHGAKGANKTTLSQTILGILAAGQDDSQTGLVATQAAKVGILDWENDRATTTYNISCLVESGAIPIYFPAYLRCSLPMVDDIERIANFVFDNQLDVVLIDSLGQAAGSDKFDSSGKSGALKFFEALRRLKVTSLIIGQESKNEEGKKSIYGSVYYQYYSRNIFELKATKDPVDKNVLHTALFHTDANFSGLYEPMGFRTTYAPGSTFIESEPVKLSQFLERASQTKNMLDFLGDGSKTVKDISSALTIAEARVRVMLTRAKDRGLVVSLGQGMWGLSTEGDEEEAGN